MKIFLDIWLRELLHDIKRIFRYRVKFIAAVMFAGFFMSLLFVGFYRVINYIKDTPIVGMALVGRVIGMVLLSLFIMLIYSSVITAFSTLFLSRDNNFLIVSPFDWGGVLLGKLVQTAFHSSWMSFIILIPLLGVLQLIFRLSAVSYVFMIPAFLFYFLSSASVGLIIVTGIVRLFPARKIRDMLITGFVVLGTSMYMLFRFLNLEQILRPGQESIATSYLSILELPQTPMLPSFWISKLVIAFINNRAGWIFPFFIMALFAAVLVTIYYFSAGRFFYKSWEKVQSEEKKRFITGDFPKNAVLAKDIKTFFRDTRQWTQLVLIFALIVIYIVNIYKMPLDLPYIHYFVAFANIGMVGAVIAAVGLRFAFSSISLEGRYFWILLTSPMERKKILIQKYIENYVPVFFMAAILVTVSNIILKPPGILNIISIVTVMVASVTVTSMGIGMGALFPKFDAVNPAEVESSWGAILYMIYSFFYVALTIAFEAVWIRMYFMSRYRGMAVYYPSVAAVVAALAVLNILANAVPLKLGFRNLNSVEFTV
ncbi:MAG: putative ABC exporter domain-containing protein [Elusimicrobiota bacterium]